MNVAQQMCPSTCPPIGLPRAANRARGVDEPGEALHEAAPGAHDRANPVTWPEVLAHRSGLVRFAQRRLHDPMLAEDVVHDVFLAVLSGRASFAGRSALRSWLTAILKHKIVDLVRQRAPFDSLGGGGIGGADDDRSDAEAGESLECPRPRPDEIAELRQRLRLTLARIDALPTGLRDVMRLRVLHEQPTEDVCRSLAISEDNLFVRLHRARKQLSS